MLPVDVEEEERDDVTLDSVARYCNACPGSLEYVFCNKIGTFRIPYLILA